MTENSDLYTDYALQMFSSYVKGDPEASDSMFASFRSEGKNTDAVFMPGLIYGLIYHLDSLMDAMAKFLGLDIEEFLEQYALAYAQERHTLVGQTLFDVEMAQRAVDSFNSLDERLKDLESPSADTFQDLTEDEKNYIAQIMLHEIFNINEGKEEDN
jgi:hypothetical protein